MVSSTMNYKLMHPEAEMKSAVAENISFRRQRPEPNANRFSEYRSQGAIWGHELLPILLRDLGSEEIQGWECIFCNERFEYYWAARQNEENSVCTA
jgi:hypothetical protein